MHAASWSRRRAVLVLLPTALLLARCTTTTPSAGSRAADRAVEAPAGTAAPRAGSTLGFELVPDPALQALIDPPPQASGSTWLGGDVAASIEVVRGRFVWLFGDTLIGRVLEDCAPGEEPCQDVVRSPDGEDAVVANSAGVMQRERGDPTPPIVKYWRADDGAPAPVLAAPEPGELLWPLAGARVGAKLLLAVSRHSRASGLYPLGNLFVLVHDPGDRPDRWRYDVHPVPNVRAGEGEADPLTWTTALVPIGDHLYVVGMRGLGLEARTVLARMPLADVVTPGWTPRPEYLLALDSEPPPVWSELFSLDDLYELDGLPGTSEATFEYHGDLGWVTFQIPPFDFQIRAYTAPALQGPWSDRGIVYRVPPPWSIEIRTDCLSPQVGCGQERFAAYAAKSHPELAPPGGFAVSYNVNILSGTLDDAIRAAEELDGFYVPQMLAGGSPPH
jgi:hypothetical protein